MHVFAKDNSQSLEGDVVGHGDVGHHDGRFRIHSWVVIPEMALHC